MSTKPVFSCALMVALVAVSAPRAQDLLPPPTQIAENSSPFNEPEPAPPPETRPPATLSSWLAYPRPECCGPIGGSGPIQYELFVRNGPSLPVEGATFGHVLETGWKVEGGGRSLFFNPTMDAAWNIDLSLDNTRFQGQHSDITIPLNEFNSSSTTHVVPVTLRNLNLTDVNVAFGREWYIWAPANGPGPRWRIGLDGGATIGSVKAEFHEIQHRNDILGGAFVSLHTDLEVPYGCCTFLAGFRTEWRYDWMDILQSQNNSDLEELNFLVTFGVRF